MIAKQGVEDALEHAAAYLEAGADGIIIHSKEEDGEEIREFCKAYAEFGSGVPLISVPTSFNQFYEEVLADMGFSIFIYANHLLRSAYPAMALSSCIWVPPPSSASPEPRTLFTSF